MIKFLTENTMVCVGSLDETNENAQWFAITIINVIYLFENFFYASEL